MVIRPHTPLAGTLTVPGDKSITHRAVFFGALNKGRTIIVNPSAAEDCKASVDLVESVGHSVAVFEDRWQMLGGKQNGHVHSMILDCRNSGTTARLGAGFLSGERGVFTITGDASLRQRPMKGLQDALQLLGAHVTSTDSKLPLIIEATVELPGDFEHLVSVSSAQVHASVVLAALRATNSVAIRRIVAMRDHTLRMLRQFDADVATEGDVDVITPMFLQRDTRIEVPGDVSSAAYLVAATVLVPGSHVRIDGVGLDPTRIAFLRALGLMGADVRWTVTQDDGEPIGTIEARYTERLVGLDSVLAEASSNSDPERVVSMLEMMDELPLLAIVASQASGTTSVAGAGELRGKESDRIAALARMLRSFGVEIDERVDGYVVCGPQVVRGGTIADCAHDHRLCMTAAVAAMIAVSPIDIPNPELASVSYPTFWSDLKHVAPNIFRSS